MMVPIRCYRMGQMKWLWRDDVLLLFLAFVFVFGRFWRKERNGQSSFYFGQLGSTRDGLLNDALLTTTLCMLHCYRCSEWTLRDPPRSGCMPSSNPLSPSSEFFRSRAAHSQKRGVGSESWVIVPSVPSVAVELAFPACTESDLLLIHRTECMLLVAVPRRRTSDAREQPQSGGHFTSDQLFYIPK
jgi:hypothetical protein